MKRNNTSVKNFIFGLFSSFQIICEWIKIQPTKKITRLFLIVTFLPKRKQLYFTELSIIYHKFLSILSAFH